MKVLTSPLSTVILFLVCMLQRLEGMTTQQYYPILERIEYVIYTCSTPSPLSPPPPPTLLLLSLLPSSTGMTLMHLSAPSHMSQQSFRWQSKKKTSSTRWDFVMDVPYTVQYQVGLRNGCTIYCTVPGGTS